MNTGRVLLLRLQWTAALSDDACYQHHPHRRAVPAASTGEGQVQLKTGRGVQLESQHQHQHQHQRQLPLPAEDG